jgi:hypothetical protein
MPIVKPIAGHTGCGRIKDYLEKNGRALARDFMNFEYQLDVEEFEDGMQMPEDFDWARAMDATRKEAANDTLWEGKRARTFKHFVLSPDPTDNMSLNDVRELARAWAKRYFSEFEVAIIYHDDNENNIPHAHIVVNNTNIFTGRRLHTDDPYELNRTLQDMAEERGFSFLRDEPVTPEKESGPVQFRASHERATLQDTYIRKSEIGLEVAGGYSWVTDIRGRVTVAKTLARNEGEFRQVLDALGIEVANNSTRAMRRDWIYSFKETPTWRVSGEKLGLTFGKTSLTERFERKSAYHPSAESSRDILSHAKGAVSINNLEDLNKLSHAIGICARYNVRSLSQLNARIARATERGSVEAVATLTQVRDYMADKKLLPENPPQQLKRKQPQTMQQQTDKRRRDEQQQLSRAQQQRQREREQNRRIDR